MFVNELNILTLTTNTCTNFPSDCVGEASTASTATVTLGSIQTTSLSTAADAATLHSKIFMNCYNVKRHPT